jgi:hypothetical protein
LLDDLDHSPGDPADVGVVLDMLMASAGEAETRRRRVGDEHVGGKPPARLDGVLEEAMRNVDRRPEQLGI